MATIYIIKGPNSGDAYSIGEDAFLIGRSSSCNVTVDDERVSGSHLQITFDKESGQHFAEDTKSTNGTWCNGKSLTRSTQLADGDQLEMGDTIVEFSTKTFESIDAAKAARSSKIDTSAPTLMDDKNRPF